MKKVIQYEVNGVRYDTEEEAKKAEALHEYSRLVKVATNVWDYDIANPDEVVQNILEAVLNMEKFSKVRIRKMLEASKDA